MNRRRLFNRLFGMTALLPAAAVARPHPAAKPARVVLTTQVMGLQWFAAKRLGYVPRSDKAVILQHMNNGVPLRARITRLHINSDHHRVLHFSFNRTD